LKAIFTYIINQQERSEEIEILEEIAEQQRLEEEELERQKSQALDD
jgi:hypothetical protein